jgi:predicted glycoside hydrolase/deacetylase ChbG (UPF0249 family)
MIRALALARARAPRDESRRKRLIVNGDDFGLSIGITDGIRLAHRYGFLTSTSMIVNMPASEYALTRLDRCAKLGIGIHLNVCQGKPLLPADEVPSLVASNGEFYSPREMARRLTQFRVASHELEAEFRAQIQWLKRRVGEVTHADSHQHMHLFPGAVGAFRRAVRDEQVRCVRASRCDSWPGRRSIGGAHAGGALRRLAVQTYRGLLQRVALARFDMPTSRIAFDADARANPRELDAAWANTFDHLPAGTYELTCHPGLMQAGFSASDRIALQREDELRWLTSEDLRAVIDRNGIELISYRDLCHRERVTESVARPAVERQVG